MTPCDRKNIEARAIIDRALASGGSVREALLCVQAMFARHAAEVLYNSVAEVGMLATELRAPAIETAEFQARKAVALHEVWEATADRPDFDAVNADVIRTNFLVRINELAINAQLWGVLR